MLRSTLSILGCEGTFYAAQVMEQTLHIVSRQVIPDSVRQQVGNCPFLILPLEQHVPMLGAHSAPGIGDGLDMGRRCFPTDFPGDQGDHNSHCLT